MPRVVPSSARDDRDLVEQLTRFGGTWEPETDPYYFQDRPGDLPQGVAVPSYFRDLLAVWRSDQQKQRTFDARTTGTSAGFVDPVEDHDAGEARKRLGWAARDLSTGSTGDVLRPNVPRRLATEFGQAARQTGALAAAIDNLPLEAGMVDTASGVPVVHIPRVTSGAAVAVQAADNAAVQETDPTTGSASAPVATVAGQVDMSRQLFDLSKPGMDLVISDDLGRDHGTKLDAQLINGTAASGQTRGLLNVSGILSQAGAVTSVQAFVSSLWGAYNQLSGPSGFGAPNPDDYLVILSPRRWAFLHGGSGAASVPVEPALPGRPVITGGVPTNLGAGTNEDVAIVAHRPSLLLVAKQPVFRVYEEVGSGTLSVRISFWAMAALLVKHPAAVAKVVGLTPPSF